LEALLDAQVPLKLRFNPTITLTTLRGETRRRNLQPRDSIEDRSEQPRGHHHLEQMKRHVFRKSYDLPENTIRTPATIANACEPQRIGLNSDTQWN
jgi:hypothetical protein